MTEYLLNLPKRLRTLSLPSLAIIPHFPRRPTELDLSNIVRIRETSSVFDSPSEDSGDEELNEDFHSKIRKTEDLAAKNQIFVEGFHPGTEKNEDPLEKAQFFKEKPQNESLEGSTFEDSPNIEPDSIEKAQFADGNLHETHLIARKSVENSLQDVDLPEKTQFEDGNLYENHLEASKSGKIPSFRQENDLEESLEDSYISLESILDSEALVCSILPSTSSISITKSMANIELIVKAKKALEKEDSRKKSLEIGENEAKIIESPQGIEPKSDIKGQETYREILITCNYGPEIKENRKRKMLCKLPKFVLYDTADQESSQVIRMIFSIANIPYEFKEVQRESIIELPLRSVPVLEIDGAKIGNTTTICRHLGWRYDLSGQTALEDSMVDMIAETIHEARQKLRPWLDHIEYKTVDYSKPECSDRFALEYLDGYLNPIIEDILLKSGSSWLIGHKLTWADVMVASFFNSIIYHRPDFFHNYPNIYLHNKKVADLEALEGMLYCVRDRKVEVSLFRHQTKPLTKPILQEQPITACT